MQYISFTISGSVAFFKDPHRNDIECTYPHIHRPAILGICGAILGLRGRESDMEYYKKLGTMGISVVPSRIKFDTFVDTSTNTTGFANIKTKDTQIIRRQMIVNPSWDIYLKQNNVDTELWNELIKRLINKNFVYTIGLGHKHLLADITNVVVGNMYIVDNTEVEYIDSMIYKCDINDIIETNRIEFTAPVSLYKFEKYWQYKNKKLFYTTNFIEDINNNVQIYNTGDRFIRFIE
jgi:CRISPR-associated protein Cas5h